MDKKELLLEINRINKQLRQIQLDLQDDNSVKDTFSMGEKDNLCFMVEDSIQSAKNIYNIIVGLTE